MRASLDTNVIIHLYRAGCQNLLFKYFTTGVYVYEQIRIIELEHHGKDIIELVDKDISSGRIELYTDKRLRDLAVYGIFEWNVKENKCLYGPGDLGEVYAISLAQTLGTSCFVTDDTKQGGPYMSLMQFEDEVMPFTYADVLLLSYLTGLCDEIQTVEYFNRINSVSELNWSFQSQIARFIKRFFQDPYRKEDVEWMAELVKEQGIKVRSKFEKLKKEIRSTGNEQL